MLSDVSRYTAARPGAFATLPEGTLYRPSLTG
jgi:hypothetical protein